MLRHQSLPIGRRLGVRLVGPLFVVVLGMAILAGGCGPGVPTLTDISSVDTLKERFNEDAGKTRIVLLLSPT